ncbi:MAG: serine--tRNA ligase [Candidatus Omnitrophota bacterium]|jgi:seryl-tRNA synthetase
MLDIKFIRENLDLVNKSIKQRGLKLDLEELLRLDQLRRDTLVALEDFRREKNVANDEISRLLKEKKDAKKKIQTMKSTSLKIDELEGKLKDCQGKMNQLLLLIPNIPHSSVPIGNASANKVVRSWGELRKFDFPGLAHTDLASALDIIDFSRAAKITGSNFALYKGWGARLERALINFMLDLHTQKHGYTEIFPPFLVNRRAMTGTGQLPKLEEDMYRLKDEDYFLVPTAEVPLTNIFAGEILQEEDLPVYYTAYTACFRREAGSYGKETKGLVRVHQFDKVELVKFVKPQDSYTELEGLVANAEKVLQLLDLPYRVVALSSEDLSFAASKCYDLEAYAPVMDTWLEVSSCSNFESFQVRRANIRYRSKDRKVDYPHTLNGSGVALARTMICILENYQQKDGSIIIPEVLRPYLNGESTITKPE